MDPNHVRSAHHKYGPKSCKVRAPLPFSADLDIFSSAYARVADPYTTEIYKSASLTPLENGAGEFLVPKECHHFPGETGFPSAAS